MQATIKLYDLDAYKTKFEAEILYVERVEFKGKDCAAIVLDKTMFFPEEGGQYADKGTISLKDDLHLTFHVFDVQIDKDGVITHYLPLDTMENLSNCLHLKQGMKVLGEIDFANRFSKMQNHTGEHIFSGIVHSLKGHENVGFHLGDDLVQMDYNGKLTSDEINDIEKKANEAVYKNISVKCYYPSEDELSKIEYRSKKEIKGAVRVVEIPGVDTCACCAPHVKTTGEIGIIKVVSFQNYKGGTRLYILCGRRAFDFISKMQSREEEISHGLKLPMEDNVKGVEKLFYENNSLKSQLVEAKKALLNYEIEKAGSSENVIIFTEGQENITIRNAVNSLMESHSGFSIILNGNNADGYSFIMGSKNVDVKAFGENLKSKLELKCGGTKEMIQGHIGNNEEAIRVALS